MYAFSHGIHSVVKVCFIKYSFFNHFTSSWLYSYEFIPFTEMISAISHIECRIREMIKMMSQVLINNQQIFVIEKIFRINLCNSGREKIFLTGIQFSSGSKQFIMQTLPI